MQDVHDALQMAGMAVTQERFCVFGMGDPTLPLMGYCPACKTGTVAVWTLATLDGAEAYTEGCTVGCPPELIYNAILPPVGA